jgi:hypothetical protein
MRKILSCAFNLDTACVELSLEDGMLLSIDCTAVENEVANTAIGAGLADLQRSAGLCRTDFEW